MQMFALCGRPSLFARKLVIDPKVALRQIPPSSSRFTLLLGLVAGLPALSIDLSAPTLAVLPAALSTTVFVAGLSLSLFVLGFGVGQLVGGRASDQIGRRPTLLVALGLYVLAGVCCSAATTGGQLATARLLQGGAAGACSVQAFAIVQDLFKGEAARRKQAYVSVVLTIMPMLAPALGALVMNIAGWRMIHLIMATGGLLLAVVVSLFVAESHSSLAPRRRSRGIGLSDSVEMLRDEGFRRIAVVNALSYGSIFAYIAGAPVVLISQLQYTNTIYAMVFACTAAALSAGALVNARLARRLDCQTLVWPALLIQAASNVGLVVCAMVAPTIEVWILLPPLLLGCFVRGIIAPNLVHAALSIHREQAGLAAALVGLLQLMTAAAASALLARVLHQFGAVSVAATMAVLSVAAFLLWTTATMRRAVPEQS